MRLTLFKYFSKGIWSIFLVSLLIFTFIIMGSQLFKIAELLVIQRINLGQVLKLLFFLLPGVLFFSLPASCLMAGMLTFLRLSKDNEMIALNASGISLYQLLPPVITFSLVIYIIASFIAIYGIPWGNRSYKDVLIEIAESKADITIKERIFFEPFKGIVFYIKNYSSKDGVMKDLFVVDQRGMPTTITIVAKKGKIIPIPEASIVSFKFEDGTIFTVDDDFESARTIHFDKYEINIDLREIMNSLTSREKRTDEMYYNELIDEMGRTPKQDMKYNQMGIKLFEMFSIPMAIFIMGILGAPLGTNIRAGGRINGIVISIGIFLMYYVSLMVARYLCDTKKISFYLGVWIPNIFLLIICIYLLYNVANDHYNRLFEMLSIETIKTKLKRT